ncbi:hypothetical protein BKA70DRAFT_732247 [Coprinopsis sp. MPI-PUGE-AT-0042]|nr:hypothetical protein BKA70DRAFT_732247 [Coprinopsis sp. MPI-PUGE-AT-0042]
MGKENATQKKWLEISKKERELEEREMLLQQQEEELRQLQELRQLDVQIKALEQEAKEAKRQEKALKRQDQQLEEKAVWGWPLVFGSIAEESLSPEELGPTDEGPPSRTEDLAPMEAPPAADAGNDWKPEQKAKGRKRKKAKSKKGQESGQAEKEKQEWEEKKRDEKEEQKRINREEVKRLQREEIAKIQELENRKMGEDHDVQERFERFKQQQDAMFEEWRKQQEHVEAEEDEERQRIEEEGFRFAGREEFRQRAEGIRRRKQGRTEGSYHNGNPNTPHSVSSTPKPPPQVGWTSAVAQSVYLCSNTSASATPRAGATRHSTASLTTSTTTTSWAVWTPAVTEELSPLPPAEPPDHETAETRRTSSIPPSLVVNPVRASSKPINRGFLAVEKEKLLSQPRRQESNETSCRPFPPAESGHKQGGDEVLGQQSLGDASGSPINREQLRLEMRCAMIVKLHEVWLEIDLQLEREVCEQRTSLMKQKGRPGKDGESMRSRRVLQLTTISFGQRW